MPQHWSLTNLSLIPQTCPSCCRPIAARVNAQYEPGASFPHLTRARFAPPPRTLTMEVDMEMDMVTGKTQARASSSPAFPSPPLGCPPSSRGACTEPSGPCRPGLSPGGSRRCSTRTERGRKGGRENKRGQAEPRGPPIPPPIPQGEPCSRFPVCLPHSAGPVRMRSHPGLLPHWRPRLCPQMGGGRGAGPGGQQPGSPSSSPRPRPAPAKLQPEPEVAAPVPSSDPVPAPRLHPGVRPDPRQRGR